VSSAIIVPAYPALAARLAPERGAGRSLALANGCFDVLHVGHVRLLREARGLADLLVVALNGDASARRLKGEGRPFVPLAERMEIVAALAGVDYVTSFDEDTADGLVFALRPSVLVKGTDREAASVPERPTLEAVGGRIAICGDPKTHASTDLGARLRAGRS
jgi:rfaE bifunctional protein nucleotidyltransferase chain/domain